MRNWSPKVGNGQQALYRRILTALEADMRAGTLRPGARLPPQRDLAKKLKLSVGTVTKAYVEAENRGLVTSRVGRGTFVADPWGQSDVSLDDLERTIDLSLNVIPSQPASRRLADSLSQLKRRSDFADTLAYAPPDGFDGHKQAAATWLVHEAGFETDWKQIIMTTGAQHGIALAVGALCKAGDQVLCESATYYGIRSIAEQADIGLCGVALDDEGMIPEALDKAALATKAKVLYVMPSCQNPTARTMGRRRRDELVAIARKRKLTIIEDDVYAMFPHGRSLRHPTLAQLAPERTLYVSSVSKSLAPGLRVGFMVCPPTWHETILRGVRASIFAPATLGAMMFAQWVDDGSAYEIAAAVRTEVAERAQIAREVLGKQLDNPIHDLPHFWIELAELDAERVAGHAMRAGVMVTPPRIPVVRNDLISGLRVCIGAALTKEQLMRGLGLLQSALTSNAGADMAVV
jgi:DNA-binding transcriptional MocR family regulator